MAIDFLSSVNLTGNPTAPTQSVGDNDTSIATTAFVKSVLAANDYVPYNKINSSLVVDGSGFVDVAETFAHIWSAAHRYSLGTTPQRALTLDSTTRTTTGTRNSHHLAWRGSSHDGTTATTADWLVFARVNDNFGSSDLLFRSGAAASFADNVAILGVGGLRFPLVTNGSPINADLWVNAAGQLQFRDNGTTITLGSGGGGSPPFDDATAIVKGSGDATKLVRIEADGITTATTRVWTAPDANTSIPVFAQIITFAGPTAARTITLPDAAFTVARTDAAQTFTGIQTFASSPTANVGGGTGSEAWGSGATTSNATRATAFGGGATIGNGADNSLAFGKDTSVAHSSAIAFGRDSTTTATNQMVVGSANTRIDNVFFGKGVASSAPTACAINGTGGSGTNIAGADLNLVAGKGTGTGATGAVNLQLANVGTTGTTLQSATTKFALSATGIAYTPSVRTSGSTSYLKLQTPADTTLAASAESIGIQLGGDSSAASVTRQISTGALTLQRENLFVAPTYGFVGSSTLTDAATVAITGAPIKGTNTTLTNTHALLVQAGAVSTATNSYGLTVNAQTGATNNYSAVFVTGNVGIGMTAPTTSLDVNGVLSFRDGGTKNRNAGLATEVNGALIQYGVNDGSSNRFGGSYTSADQGGFIRFDSRSGETLLQIWGRAAGVANSSGTLLFTIQSNGIVGLTAPVTLKGYTVAGLPTGVQGMKVFVTDALAPTYLVTVVGGGAVVTEVFYNGSTWVCT